MKSPNNTIKPPIKVKSSDFSTAERALLEKYSPCLAFEETEVLFPVRVGVSVIYKKTHPPSLIWYYENFPSRYKFFKFLENLFLVILYGDPPFVYEMIRDRFQPVLMSVRHRMRVRWAAKVLEYAIYYDSDIQHIYDLEHVWVYLDAYDQPIGVKATRHGMFVTQYETPEEIVFRGTHPILYVSPGKHAHYTSPSQLNRRVLTYVNNFGAGKNGMHKIPFFTREIWERIFPYFPGKKTIQTIFWNRFARVPTFRYKLFKIVNWDWMIPWTQLESEIPDRVINFLQSLTKPIEDDDEKE